MSRPSHLAAFAAALACALAGTALAQEAGGVRITGNVQKHTVVGGSANIASGPGARAVTSIGTISSGVSVRGDLQVTVSVDDVATVADQAAEEAITSIGSVHEGAEVTGRRSVVVSTGRIVNMGDGKNPGCVIIGSIGEVPGC